MFKIKLLVVVALLSAMTCSTSIADMIISVDLSPQAGVQNTSTLSVGDTFTANLLLDLQLTPPAVLDSYRFSVDYDPAGLQVVGATRTPLANFTSLIAPADSVNLAHVVSPFEASANVFGAGPSSLNQAVVGSITFKVLSASGAGGFAITPFEDPIRDGSFDSTFSQITPIFQGATITVTAVPEPSSMALLGLVGAVALYRKRKSLLCTR